MTNRDDLSVLEMALDEGKNTKTKPQTWGEIKARFTLYNRSIIFSNIRN